MLKIDSITSHLLVIRPQITGIELDSAKLSGHAKENRQVHSAFSGSARLLHFGYITLSTNDARRELAILRR
jgi:hypothetical protein